MSTEPTRIVNTDRISELEHLFADAADALRYAGKRPYGRHVSIDMSIEAGKACVALCNGDHDQARTLWKVIAADCDGYMPHAAAAALIRAAATTNLVPDVSPPEVS